MQPFSGGQRIREERERGLGETNALGEDENEIDVSTRQIMMERKAAHIEQRDQFKKASRPNAPAEDQQNAPKGSGASYRKNITSSKRPKTGVVRKNVADDLDGLEDDDFGMGGGPKVKQAFAAPDDEDEFFGGGVKRSGDDVDDDDPLAFMAKAKQEKMKNAEKLAASTKTPLVAEYVSGKIQYVRAGDA